MTPKLIYRLRGGEEIRMKDKASIALSQKSPRLLQLEEDYYKAINELENGTGTEFDVALAYDQAKRQFEWECQAGHFRVSL